MGYVLFHISSKRRVKWYFTERGAMAARTIRNRNACDWIYDITSEKEYVNNLNNEAEVKDPMIGLFSVT